MRSRAGLPWQNMKKKVLVVDDDRSVRESVSKVLTAEDYEVVLAADGQEALDRFNSGRIDLLLLDIGLPMRSGWETFERITSENPLVPIIIITGQANQHDMALAAGVGALMEKPLEARTLLETMRELLAEPYPDRLRRLCGYSQDTRYTQGGSARLLKRLREQHKVSRPPRLGERGTARRDKDDWSGPANAGEG